MQPLQIMPSAIVGVVAPSSRAAKEPQADGGSTFSPNQPPGGGNRMSANNASSSSPSIKKTPPPTAMINPNNATRNRFGFHSSPKKITSSHATPHSSTAVTSATVHPPPRYLRRNSMDSTKSSTSVGHESPPAKPARNKNLGGGCLAVATVASIAAGGIENNNNNASQNVNNNNITRIHGAAQRSPFQSPSLVSPYHQRATLSPARVVNVSSAKAGYMCIKPSTAEELDSAEEFVAAMQYCGKQVLYFDNKCELGIKIILFIKKL